METGRLREIVDLGMSEGSSEYKRDDAGCEFPEHFSLELRAPLG